MVMSELHLSDVAGLVNGQGLYPRHRFRHIGILDRIKVHPVRSPGDRAVGHGMESMQNYRRWLFEGKSGKKAYTPGDRPTVQFQLPSVHPCQRIQALRIYYFI